MFLNLSSVLIKHRQRPYRGNVARVCATLSVVFAKHLNTLKVTIGCAFATD